MARGQNNGTENFDLFFIGVRGLKADETPHFKQVKALGDKKYDETLPNITNIGGVVHKVGTKVRQSEKYGPSEELELWLKDIKHNELYCVSCGMNSIGRSIINSLAAVEGNLGEVELSIYKNPKGYASISVKHNGKRTDWKLTLEQQKAYIKETTERAKGTDGKIVEKIKRDYLDLDAFLIDMWKKEVGSKVQNFAQTEHPEPNAVVKNDEPSEYSSEPVAAGADDLPF